MRLDKFLAHNNFGTRKDVKKIIKSKQVIVNGEVVTDAGYTLNIESDSVSVAGEILQYKKQVYYMMHKPAGYECSHDSTIHPSVLELMDVQRNDLFFVGRLDVDTEGLLLITNDGQFSHRIIHGKRDIYKKYYVSLKTDFDTSFVSQLEAGVPFEASILKPAQVEIIDAKTILLSIAEGKYHQVKRMMHYCNNEVLYLKRIAVGNLSIDETLELGSYRELTDAEIALFD